MAPINPEPPVTTTRWPVKSSSAGSTAGASTPLTIAPTYTVASGRLECTGGQSPTLWPTGRRGAPWSLRLCQE